LWLCAPLLEQRFGIALAGEGAGAMELWLAMVVVLASVIIGAVPAWRAYRNTLADGLTLRV
jgi:putative ABC transport system permease protein